MAFPGQNYAPPSVYTRTLFENPFSGSIDSLKIPVFIGEGNEFLIQRNLELVRGSSASIDQRRVNEDMTGRAVVSVSVAGVVTLGAWNGVLTKLKVANLPIVIGDGTGTVSTSRSDVSVTINSAPIVVLSVEGTTGIVELAQAPLANDIVKITYFYNRTDTLVTDTVSDQVSAETARVEASAGIYDVNSQTPATADTISIHADILTPSGGISVPANNVLELIIDGAAKTITIPANPAYTMIQAANAIAAQGAGTSLTGTTFINNFGHSALQLGADQDITVLSGTANAILGLIANSTSTRVKTFYTFQGPIVDGTNGGVTSTDPSHVTVKVNGVQIIPTKLVGSTRAVTLAAAPAPNAIVTIQYWFNSWQDTFDYLQHSNVSTVTSVGSVPDTGDFTAKADFILKDSKILWGTAWTVEADETSAGSELFDDTQISGTLIDNRTYLSLATAVVTTSGGVSTASQRDFLLPFPPTLGNGRDTKLGSSLFQTVSNGRIDLPVNRPDVVDAYWGYSVQDALDRGKLTVLKVEGSVVSIDEDVPPGATFFASFYYNRLTDETYTLTNKLAGASGTGTYEIAKKDATSVLGASYSTASKGAGLLGITLVFPSGSELTPDLRHESVSGTQFTGPVEETVTVEFATKLATPAKYSVPGASPYHFVTDQSDHVRIRFDNDANSADPDGAGGGTEATGIPLDNPTSFGGGFFTSLVGKEIDYTGSPVGAVANDAIEGESFFLTTAEDIVLFIDGVQVDVTIPASPLGGGGGTERSTVADFVTAINVAACGFTGAATAGGATTIDISALGIPNALTAGHYVGWRVIAGSTAVLPTAGDTQTVTAHSAAGVLTTVAWAGGAMAAGDEFRLYDPATMGEMLSSSRFNGATTIGAGDLDTLAFEYRGNNGATGTYASGDCVIAPATYASATALATAVGTAINGALGFDVDGGVWGAPGLAFAGARVEVTADGDGRLRVKLQLSGLDNQGSFRFILPTTGILTHFHTLAGFDAGTVGGTDGAVLIEGEVAKLVVDPVPVAGTQHHNDRIILRNRLLPGGNTTSSMTAHDILGQMELRVGAGSGNTKAGFVVKDEGEGGFQATIRPASLASFIGTAGGQDAGTQEPLVTFFSGAGATAVNNVFDFTMDGVAVQVTFADAAAAPVAAAGSAVPIGPISNTNSVSGQILRAISLLPGTPFGAGTGNIVVEGAGLRLISSSSEPLSAVIIGTGSANATLRYTAGAVSSRTLVSARLLASALNGCREDSFSAFLHDFSSSQGAGTPMFQNLGYAWVAEDAASAEYLYLQSLSAGTGSVITLRDPVVGGITTDSWLFSGTGINAVSLAGAVGEAGISGFFVISNKATGSGSNNDSLLNDGVGSDGTVGQTYRDPVTGLSFTVLPRGFHDNEVGPWQAYPTGGTATFRLAVSKTHTTNSNIPITSLPGLELKVANTLDIGVDDTAEVTSYERGGEEPTVGDVYYATYTYKKDSFSTAYFTKMSAIEQAYGEISGDNPVTLAAFLCSLNGAVLMGIKQVPKAAGSSLGSLTDYKAAIASLEGVQPGQVNPDIVIPLRGDSTDLYTILKKSNEIQSSIRYKSERTSIVGMSSGNDAKAVQKLAQTLSSDRMRVVYPDTAVLRLTDAFNKTETVVVDGTMIAAALAGSVVSPNVDVATPWTGKNLVGFLQLGRLLDAVEMNQTASKGVTVIEERPPFMRVRHGLTTDMSNVLRKTPTVRMISDEVQRQARITLANFIGVKFLPGILTQVEGRLAMMLKSFVTQQIITAYTGIKAKTAPDDPTVAEVDAFYQPVFPLLYIILTFHLRSSL